MTYTIEQLSSERFAEYWPQIEAQLRTVPQYWAPWWTLESIRERTMDGTFQCWGVGSVGCISSVCFTQFCYYPAGTLFQVFLAFGTDLTEAVDELNAVFELYARARGATRIEVTGRPGWVPLLRKHGFQVNSQTMTRRLDNIRMR